MNDGAATEAECSICLHPLPVDGAACELPCGHRFHSVCILRAASAAGEHVTCPLCRADVLGDQHAAERREGEARAAAERVERSAYMARRRRLEAGPTALRRKRDAWLEAEIAFNDADDEMELDIRLAMRHALLAGAVQDKRQRRMDAQRRAQRQKSEYKRLLTSLVGELPTPDVLENILSRHVGAVGRQRAQSLPEPPPADDPREPPPVDLAEDGTALCDATTL